MMVDSSVLVRSDSELKKCQSVPYGLTFLAKRVAPNQYFANPQNHRGRGPDAGRRRLGPGRTRARGTGPRFRPQVAELVVRGHDDQPQTHTQHLSMLETVGRWSYVVGERRGRVPRSGGEIGIHRWSTSDPHPASLDAIQRRTLCHRRRQVTRACSTPSAGIRVRLPRPRSASARSRFVSSSRRAPRAQDRGCLRSVGPHSARPTSTPGTRGRIEPSGLFSEQRRRFFEIQSGGVRAELPCSYRKTPRRNEHGSRIPPTTAVYGPGHRNRRVCAPRTNGNGSRPSQHAGLRHALPRGAAGSRTVPRVPLVGASPGPGNMNIWKSAIGSPVYRQGMSQARGEPAGGSRGGCAA